VVLGAQDVGDGAMGQAEGVDAGGDPAADLVCADELDEADGVRDVAGRGPGGGRGAGAGGAVGRRAGPQGVGRRRRALGAATVASEGVPRERERRGSVARVQRREQAGPAAGDGAGPVGVEAVPEVVEVLTASWCQERVLR